MPPCNRRRPDTVARKCAVEDGTGGSNRKKFNFHRPYRFENSTRSKVFFRLKNHEFVLQRRNGTVTASASLMLEVGPDSESEKFKSDGDIKVIYTIKYKDGQGKPTIVPDLMIFQFSPQQHGKVTRNPIDLGTIKFDQIHSVCWAISHYTVLKA